MPEAFDAIARSAQTLLELWQASGLRIWHAIAAAGVLGIVVSISILWTGRPRYRRQDSLLTPAEQRFLQSLRPVMDRRLTIFAKVRVADVITPRRRGDGRSSEWWSDFRKISQKHFDFVLVDTHTSAIVAAIELDDKSHHQRHRQRRDRFLNTAMAGAGVPLLRVPVKRGYREAALREQLDTTLEAAGYRLADFRRPANSP
ncbi:MAG: DUF2726 domain-containing protein [Chromatiaceae bacterium]|nr:MAG: DUF2726 domain-containing protein [Chromatiaceae bacterium]